MLLPSFFFALQAILHWWISACAAQGGTPAGFLSIDCGSQSPTSYNDSGTGLVWTPDAGLMKEGQHMTVGAMLPPLDTMRLFTGNHTKYCYTLTDDALTPGAFFLVRASFWKGSNPPYTPQSGSYGTFHFKLLIDADEWSDVWIPTSSTTWYYYEIYVQALRSSIDVCLARVSPDSDPPFISAIELRPLPFSLTPALVMINTTRNILPVRVDYMSASSTSASTTTRYPLDQFDRLWVPVTMQFGLSSNSSIITSKDPDVPPSRVLQTVFGGTADTPKDITVTFWDLDVNEEYYCLMYFAEIDPAVNATGQRVFDIVVSGVTLNGKPIDVFREVGPNAGYEFLAGPLTAPPNGIVVFTLSATASSTFSPSVAAVEFFKIANRTFSNGTASNDVMAIENLKTSMNLSSFTGDPCLPLGYEYSFLSCTNSTTAPRVTSLSLSNYDSGGMIPESINTLTMLEQILLDGNGLKGSIPDLSALTRLQTLDLSNNNLSGSIPASLATMKNLRVLRLQNNNLSGRIPNGLIGSSTLDFEFSGNPLCQNYNCTSSRSSIKPSKSKSKMSAIIGIIVGVVAASVIICLGVFCLYKKKKTGSTLEQPLSGANQQLPLYQGPKANIALDKPVRVLSIQEFTFQEISAATNNFRTKLGKGGFGPVYKGTLQDGQIVAVKVASNGPSQVFKEFLNEVDLLSRIHHKNLLALLGYCTEGTLVLVYEFMSKGSLFDNLHGEYSKASPLSWSTRLRILVDSAQGIDYLHNGCNPRIFHRDIKSSNILLDDNMDAKISDFGISRNCFVHETRAPTTNLMGTMGYIDPEYLTTMRLTEKVDVYGFGVLIFEVVCGRRAVFLDASNEQMHIADWVKSSIDYGMIDEIVDASMCGQYNISSVWKVVEIALACLEFPSSQRPTMSVVCSELKEAQRLELGSQQTGASDNPSTTSHGQDFTCVRAR